MPRPLVTLVVLFLLTTLVAAAQSPRAMSFDAADAAGVSVDALDSTYAPGFEMFGEGAAKYPEAWESMLRAIGGHLKESAFRWTGPSEFFLRVYFDASGAIDHLLYNAPEAADAAALGPVLSDFAATYRFPLAADRRFVQCGSVTFQSP